MGAKVEWLSYLTIALLDLFDISLRLAAEPLDSLRVKVSPGNGAKMADLVDCESNAVAP